MRLRLLLTGGTLLAAVLTGVVVWSPPGLPSMVGAERAAGPSPPPAAAPVPDAGVAPAPAPSASTEPPAEPPPDRALQALRRRLDAVVTAPGLSRDAAEVAVAVRTPDGMLVYGHRANARMLPASTVKLVTAATALLVLGPDRRLVTTVDTAAPVRGGALDGDLVLTGGGDPVLATPAHGQFVAPARPRTPLEDLADDVVAQGIHTVRGDVVADPSVLGGPTVASGWKRAYLDELDARRVRGLTVDGGLAVSFRGVRSAEGLVVEAAEDPARQAAAALRRLLEARGVRVEGRIRVADAPVAAATTLGRVASPPLRRLLTHMVRESDNHLADTLLRVAAARRGRDGSWRSAAATAVTVLEEEVGVDAAGMILADGSGLSRTDRVSAAQLSSLDAAMAASEHARPWSRIKAVSGRSGTLERRLDDTVADGAFRGKTGTLDDVVAIAGSVHGPDDRRLHVAVIGNRAAGERDTVRTLADEVVLRLAEHQRGCTRRPRPDTTGPAVPPYVPPYRLACPGPGP